MPPRNLLDFLRSAEKSSISRGSLAQLGEHLPYKQRVIGSIPITSTKSAGMAELADALDLGSSD